MAQASLSNNLATFCPVITELWLKMHMYGKGKVIVKVTEIYISSLLASPK